MPDSTGANARVPLIGQEVAEVKTALKKMPLEERDEVGFEGNVFSVPSGPQLVPVLEHLTRTLRQGSFLQRTFKRELELVKKPLT